MAKSVKYKSYEEWVLGRIANSKLKTMSTASLMKLPDYLYDLEIEPCEHDLEVRLRAMRNLGQLSVSAKRWTIRGDFVPPNPPNPKRGPKPHPKQLNLLDRGTSEE